MFDGFGGIAGAGVTCPQCIPMIYILSFHFYTGFLDFIFIIFFSIFHFLSYFLIKNIYYLLLISFSLFCFSIFL